MQSTRTSIDSLGSTSSASLGDPRSIASLVYAHKRDPYAGGYKQPTTSDIPQVKLPRIELGNTELVDEYLKKSCDDSILPEQHSVPSLSEVPSVFFDADFQLDNPRVFDAVLSEDSTLSQEKLSHYVDIVEANLECEVANSSSQFFLAAAKFNKIEGEAKASHQGIQEFEKQIGAYDNVVAHFKESQQLQAKLHECDQIVSSLEVVQQLRERITSTETSLSTYTNNPEAENIITAYKNFNECSAVVNENGFLTQLTVAQKLLEKLSVCEIKIRNFSNSCFVQLLLSDLKSGDGDAKGDVAKDGSNNTLISQAEQLWKVCSELDTLPQAQHSYSQDIDKEFKLIIRRHLPTSSSDNLESQALAKSLHAMSPEEADLMCSQMFADICVLLRKLKNQVEYAPFAFKLSSSQQVHPDMPNLQLTAALRAIDNRVSRVLRVRKDPATVLTVGEFCAFFAAVSNFCSTCEDICKTRPVELSEFLVAQTKLYIHALHEDCESTLSKAMDADDWKRVEVPQIIQELVDIIALSSTLDDCNWPEQTQQTPALNFILAVNTSPSRISVDGELFVISKSVCKLVQILADFLQLASSLPSMHGSAVALTLVELLRTYNQRCHHLILGFGATKTAGLKHISVKNLLLASENLRLVHTLIPIAKRCLERHLPDLPSSQYVLVEFDSVRQGYFDHRLEIQRKLITLMSTNATNYCRQIGITDFSLGTDQANKYMTDLMRQTTTVANFAYEMLPPEMAENLVFEIYSVYKPKLLEAFSTLEVKTPSEKRNVLKDLLYFKTKSELLKGAGNVADVVYESVNGFVAPHISVSDADPEPAVAAVQSTSVETPSKPTTDTSSVVTNNELSGRNTDDNSTNLASSTEEAVAKAGDVAPTDSSEALLEPSATPAEEAASNLVTPSKKHVEFDDGSNDEVATASTELKESNTEISPNTEQDAATSTSEQTGTESALNSKSDDHPDESLIQDNSTVSTTEQTEPAKSENVDAIESTETETVSENNSETKLSSEKDDEETVDIAESNKPSSHPAASDVAEEIKAEQKDDPEPELEKGDSETQQSIETPSEIINEPADDRTVSTDDNSTQGQIDASSKVESDNIESADNTSEANQKIKFEENEMTKDNAVNHSSLPTPNDNSGNDSNSTNEVQQTETETADSLPSNEENTAEHAGNIDVAESNVAEPDTTEVKTTTESKGKTKADSKKKKNNNRNKRKRK